MMDVFGNSILFTLQLYLGYCVAYMSKYNELLHFPSDIPVDETVINLQGNNLTFIHSSEFKDMFSLVTLKLSENFLEEVPDTGDAKSQLEHLDVRENRISKVDAEQFAGYVTLKTLLLNRNLLTEFPDLGDAKLTLTTLELEYNFIKHTHRDVFKGYQELTVLKLKANMLAKFPDLFYVTNANFQLLSLSNNQITHFYPWVLKSVAQGLTFTSSLKVDSNPVICDCRSIYFAQFTKTYASALSGIKCDSPSSMRGLQVENVVPIDQLLCEGL